MLLLLLLVMSQSVIMTCSVCQSNQDRRVSCVSLGLVAVPDGIQLDMQVLVLRGNCFTSLSWSSYSGFKELQELDLSHNLITALDPPGPVLEKLSVLRLSSNRLTGLGGLAFRCAPNLMEIHLDSNRIHSLHDSTFGDLRRLEVIALSQNALPALPARLLEHVSSSALKSFDLENNSVSLMPHGFFSSKPELPYVYLSHNPWLCGCAVGYLHTYLNDQEHNVYNHDGPNSIVPGADSVLCSGPAHLALRPVMELEEHDFCPAEAPPNTRGDMGLDNSDVVRSPSPQTAVAPHASTQPWTGVSSWVTDESWTETWSESYTSTPVPGLVTSLQSRDSQVSRLTTPSDWPSTSESTARAEPPTAGATDPEPHGRGPSGAAPPGPVHAQAGLGVWRLPWCRWLFAGFTLMCGLSSLTSCFLCLWLLRMYLAVYRGLERWGMASDGVTLLAYRSAEPAHHQERVSFLPREQIRHSQAVFRSVLFISPRQPRRGVFRKMLRREISPEQEAEDWTEEEACPHGATAHYRLILREERGQQPREHWLLGEWQLQGGGVVYHRSSSLIGQPSSIALDTDDV